MYSISRSTCGEYCKIWGFDWTQINQKSYGFMYHFLGEIGDPDDLETPQFQCKITVTPWDNGRHGNRREQRCNVHFKLRSLVITDFSYEEMFPIPNIDHMWCGPSNIPCTGNGINLNH